MQKQKGMGGTCTLQVSHHLKLWLGHATVAVKLVPQELTLCRDVSNSNHVTCRVSPSNTVSSRIRLALVTSRVSLCPSTSLSWVRRVSQSGLTLLLLAEAALCSGDTGGRRQGAGWGYGSELLPNERVRWETQQERAEPCLDPSPGEVSSLEAGLVTSVRTLLWSGQLKSMERTAP